MSRTTCTKLAKWGLYCTSARGSSPIPLCDDCKGEINQLLGGLARRGVYVSATWAILDHSAHGPLINPQRPKPGSRCESTRALR